MNLYQVNAKRCAFHRSATSGSDGTEPTVLANDPCSEVELENLSSVSLYVYRNETGDPWELVAGAARIFDAITNSNELSVKREDEVSTAADFQYEAREY